MKRPAPGVAVQSRSQIPLAECIVLDVNDEGVTEADTKSPALGRGFDVDSVHQ